MKFNFEHAGVAHYITILMIQVYSEANIISFVVKTSNCQHCGMGWHGSNLKLSVSNVWIE